MLVDFGAHLEIEQWHHRSGTKSTSHYRFIGGLVSSGGKKGKEGGGREGQKESR